MAKMTINELKRRVAGGEDLYTEFKRKLPEWEKLIREVVAFANTKGGWLLIGVDDDGSIPGIRDAREIEEVVDLRLNEYCRPAPVYEMESLPLSAKKAVVIIHVMKSTTKPHYALDAPDAKGGTVLVRIADNSVKCSREKLELLKFEGRERNIKVELGEKEGVLMKYLESKPFITAREFMKAAGISSQVASRTLVHLCKARVLQLEPQVEGPDRFRLIASFEE